MLGVSILPLSVICLLDFGTVPIVWGSSWSWSYSLIYNYLCNQCLSPQKLWVWTPFMGRCTQYNIIWYSLSVTCGRSMVFSSIPYQYNCPPRHSWNIVESGNKYHKPNLECNCSIIKWLNLCKCDIICACMLSR